MIYKCQEVLLDVDYLNPDFPDLSIIKIFLSGCELWIFFVYVQLCKYFLDHQLCRLYRVSVSLRRHSFGVNWIRISDPRSVWIMVHERTGESTLVMDLLVPLIHHDPERSWITDPDPDHPKGMQPNKEV